MKTKEIITAIRTEKGNVTAVASKIGIARSALYLKIAANPALKAAIDEARESMLDTAEHVLHEKVAEGEPWAVCFYLKTQGKRRGYVERQEISGAEGGRIIIEVDSGRNTIKSVTESGEIPAIDGEVPGIHRRDRIGQDMGGMSEGAAKM